MIEFLKKVFIGVMLVACIVAIVRLSFQYYNLKHYFTSIVASFVSDITGYKVVIDDIEFSLPFNLKTDYIAAEDVGGIFLEANNLNISIEPTIFFLWKLNIDRISGDRIKIVRIPEKKTSFSVNDSKLVNTHEQNSTKYFLPNIDIGNVQIDQLIFTSAVTGLLDELKVSINSNLFINNIKQLLKFSLHVTDVSSINELPIDDIKCNIEGSYNLDNLILSLLNMNLKSSILDIQGSSRIDFFTKKLFASFEYSSDILKMLISDYTDIKEGHAEGKLNLSGDLDKIQIEYDSDISLNVPDNDFYKLSDISSKIIASYYPNKNYVDGTMLMKHGAMNISGSFTWNDYKLDLVNVKTVAPGFEKMINFSFDSKKKMFDGTLNVKGENIESLSELFPFIIGGSIDLTSTYNSNTNNNQKQTLGIRGTMRDINTKFGKADLIDFDISFSDLFKLQLAKSKISITEPRYDNVDFDHLEINAKSINDNSWNVNFLVSDENWQSVYPFAMIADAIVSYNSTKNHENISVKVTDLSGKFADAEIKNAREISLSYHKNNKLDVVSYTVDNTRIIINDGTFDITGSYDSYDTLKLSVNLDKIPFHKIRPDFGNNFKTINVSGKIDLDNKQGEPNLYTAIVVDTKLSDKTQKNNSIHFVGGIDKGLLHYHVQVGKIDTSYTKSSEIEATSDIMLPVHFTIFPLHFLIKPDKKISISVDATNAYQIIDLIASQSKTHNISAILNGKIHLTGTMNNPKLNGGFMLSDGRYKYLKNNIVLYNINANITANDDMLLIDSYAEDLSGKKLLINGQIQLSELFPFKMQLNTKELYILNNIYVNGEIDANISIIGDRKSARASGDLLLGPLNIKIMKQLFTNIPSLNIAKVIGKREYVVAVQEEEYNIITDIMIKTKKQVFIDGFGVEARLEGNLHVTDDIADPNIIGTMKLLNGRYQAFGKYLDLKHGEIVFNGLVPPSPYLDIIGSTNVNDTEIEVKLSNSIINPKLTINSIPKMSEEDALSMLLFGQGLESISALQTVQLTYSLGLLGGASNKINPIYFGKKILPIDYLNLKQDSRTNDDLISIGKYFTDKIYLEIEQAIQNNHTKSKIGVRLTPNIVLENINSQNDGNSLWFNWQINY